MTFKRVDGRCLSDMNWNGIPDGGCSNTKSSGAKNSSGARCGKQVEITGAERPRRLVWLNKGCEV